MIQSLQAISSNNQSVVLHTKNCVLNIKAFVYSVRCLTKILKEHDTKINFLQLTPSLVVKLVAFSLTHVVSGKTDPAVEDTTDAQRDDDDVEACTEELCDVAR